MLNLASNPEVLPLSKTNPKALGSLFGTTDIDPFWVADQDYEVAEPIQRALIERITHASLAYEYKPESYFQAQQKWYSRKYGINLDRNEILYSPAIITSISILLENFTQEGDGVIIQPPVFMHFREVIKTMGRRVIKNPLRLNDGHYEIDFDNLEREAALPGNKVLILCNPHNPVGKVWTRTELQKIIDISRKYDLLLIADEIYKDIILFGHRFTSILHFKDQHRKIAVCTSEAKTFNLTGITDSMVIVPHEEIRQPLASSFNKYHLGRTNALTRVAWETAYKEGGPWVDQLIQALEENVKTIQEELKTSPVKLIPIEGTNLVWLDFRAIFHDSREMFEYVIEKSGIGLNAGHWFGREGALFMRMNIATSQEKVIRSIRAVKEVVNEYLSLSKAS